MLVEILNKNNRKVRIGIQLLFVEYSISYHVCSIKIIYFYLLSPVTLVVGRNLVSYRSSDTDPRLTPPPRHQSRPIAAGKGSFEIRRAYQPNGVGKAKTVGEPKVYLASRAAQTVAGATCSAHRGRTPGKRGRYTRAT